MKFKFLLPLCALCAFISCGKKEEKPEEVIPQPVIPDSEREAFLNKQELYCEPGAYCPDYIAKIVVFDKGSPRYCTGTLVSKNKVLTSASCLPSYLRSTDVDCGNDVFLFFNRGSRPPDRVNCKSVLQVSTLDGNNTQYWRDDVAVIELGENLYWREYKDVVRKGMKDGDKVRFFGVDQSNQFTGIIRKEECEVVHKSYLYPLSSTESSPNVLMAGCYRKQGYRGAAVMDSFPRIRGVVADNSPLRGALENSPLLIKPLKDFIHVTNFACAPFLNETSALNEQECAKPLDYSTIAGERSRLLSDEERYGSLVQKLERAAEGASKYFKVSASLLTEGDRQSVSFKPVCFKNVSSWLSAVMKDGSVTETPNFPARTLRKGVDSYGRAVTQETEEETIKYYLTFSGKRLYKEKLSDVFVSTEDTETERIHAIRACP